MSNESIYQRMKKAKIETDSHCSDLYVPCNTVTAGILRGFFKDNPDHPNNITRFNSAIDGSRWYDIPFAYDPYWERRKKTA